jgi:hypothetical protein
VRRDSILHVYCPRAPSDDPIPLRMSFLSTSPRQRSIRPGREAELINSLIASGFEDLVQGSFVTFREPEIATGVPDLVIVEHHSVPDTRRPLKGVPIHTAHLNLLHHIYHGRQKSLPSISKRLNWQEKTLRSYAEHLASHNLIRLNDRRIDTEPLDDVFAASKVVAIEAKTTFNRVVVEQALANKWFASHSYVAVPESQVTSKKLQWVREQGIGVIAIKGNLVHLSLKAVRQRLPASPGSWVFNYWASQ